MAKVTADYVQAVWYRLSKGKPQPMSGVWRVAIEDTLDAALQRVSDRIAADDGLYPLLVNQYALVLTSGEVAINALVPVLLVSTASRKRWRVTMVADGVRFPLKYLPNRSDLDNPPPTQDYYFYTIFNNLLVVRDSTGAVPGEVNVEFFGSYAALISNPAFDGEVFDNLIDVGVAIIMESESLPEVIRQAEMTTAVAPGPAASA